MLLYNIGSISVGHFLIFSIKQAFLSPDDAQYDKGNVHDLRGIHLLEGCIFHATYCLLYHKVWPLCTTFFYHIILFHTFFVYFKKFHKEFKNTLNIS